VAAAAVAADMTDDFHGINFHPFFLRRLKRLLAESLIMLLLVMFFTDADS